MIMFSVQKDSDTRAMVLSIHFDPFNKEYGLGKTKEELESEGFLFVDEVKKAEEKGNMKVPVLYINPETLEQWYEYVDRPLTVEERLDAAESKNGELTQAVVELSMTLAAKMGA